MKSQFGLPSRNGFLGMIAALHHSTNHVVGVEQTWGRDKRLQQFRDRQQLGTE
jgi:hypothetical protein